MRRSLTLALSVFLTLTLSACATSGRNGAGLLHYPEIPSDLRACFDGTVPSPPVGALTKAQISRLIASLKLSEAEKAECGRRLLSFYDNLSAP